MFIAVAAFCSTLAITDCVFKQNAASLFPTREACEQAIEAIRPSQAAAGITLYGYCAFVPVSGELA